MEARNKLVVPSGPWAWPHGGGNRPLVGQNGPMAHPFFKGGGGAQCSVLYAHERHFRSRQVWNSQSKNSVQDQRCQIVSSLDESVTLFYVVWSFKGWWPPT